ncbi:MAG: UDP-glucose 4-epimerase GalE, partial [Rhodospirillaceae bacterium]|nr:UDP-glucose 4-epimerase GalE [Rhodospirillaceae bacterium]
GYGRGYTGREGLAAVERRSGRPLRLREAPRRPGDPAELVAATGRLRQLFGWRPRYDDLDAIVATALAWEERLPGIARASTPAADLIEP